MFDFNGDPTHDSTIQNFTKLIEKLGVNVANQLEDVVLFQQANGMEEWEYEVFSHVCWVFVLVTKGFGDHLIKYRFKHKYICIQLENDGRVPKALAGMRMWKFPDELEELLEYIS